MRDGYPGPTEFPQPERDIGVQTGTTPMRIRVLTLFPEMFDQPLSASIVGRARESEIVHLTVHDIRDYTHDRHRTVDDEPYGGGPGMVLKPGPLQEGVDGLKEQGRRNGEPQPRVVLMSPQGVPFDQAAADRLARLQSVVFVCGHYEGVDERFIERSVDEEISIGDYVLTGGEVAAMVVIDAVVRLLPGALGDPGSAGGDSFGAEAGGLLQGPVYTRPKVWEGLEVPDVLTSGDHARIATWRRQQALERTRLRRPDLLEGWP